VYSCNVPVPDDVARLASALAATCFDADGRTRHTLVGKRLGDGRFPDISRRARAALEGMPPFAARVVEVGSFENPPVGRAPVVYLTVESPGLWEVHERLCEVFEPVPGFEGTEYDPHVTIARGGDAAKLLEETFPPIEWQVERLEFWDPEHREVVETVSLPA
jgi:2'-5' RNA ligase